MNKIKQLIVSLCVVGLILSYWKNGIVFAEDETVVGGKITANTVWTKEHSPYRVTNTIVLADGVNLTIEKGVTILFNENTRILAENGKLTVNGTSDEKVIFQFAQTSNDFNEDLWLGSENHLVNFEINDARIGLDINGQNNKIENGSINNSTLHGIEVEGKYNEILNNRLNSNRTGIMLNGNENHIIGNEIQSSLEDGINLQHSNKNIFINNQITHSEKYGVYSDAPYWSLVNYFYHNTFSENKLGINTSTANVFTKNNIYDLVNIIKSDLWIMDLSQNYWGTTVESEINQRITLPDSSYIVNITPYLTESSGLVEKVIPTEPVLYPIKDHDDFIKGKAEPLAKVTFNQNEWAPKIEIVADENGNFQSPYRKLPAGVKVEAFVTNEYGMKSNVVSTIVLDETKPTQPILEEVSNQSNSIRGVGEIGSKVLVKNSEQIIAEGVIGVNGQFEVNIPIQKAGTVLTIILTDSSGNTSDPLSVNIKDRIAPEKPIFVPIDTSSTSLTGTSEPGTIVKLYNENEMLIKEAKTNEKGTYLFNIDQYFLGTKLFLKAIDQDSNISEKTVISVGMASPNVEEYSNTSSILKGRTEPNATVWIKADNYLKSIVANENGEFEDPIGYQKEGTIITIRAVKDGFTNETVLVVSDKTAPLIPDPITSVTDLTKEIIGFAEPNSIVTVKANGVLLGKDVTDLEYIFKIPITIQKAGVKLEFQAIDQAGNMSEVYVITVEDSKPVLKATTNTYNSVNLSWSEVGNVSGYEIYRSTSSTGTFTKIATTTNTSYLNTSLNTGTTYYYKIRAYKTDTPILYSEFSSILSVKPSLSTPTSVKAASLSYNSVRSSWGAVSGASGYEVYRATTSTGTYSKVGTTTLTSFNNTGLTTNKAYYYKIKAYRMVGSTKVYGNYSSVFSAKPILGTPTSVKAASSSYNSVKTSWAAVSGASGYEVYRATSSTGTYSKVVTTTSTSYSNTGLSTNKTYYYKIKSYRTVGSTKYYSNYSSVVSAKPIPAVPTNFNATRVNSSSIKLSWSTVSGASGYEIYRSTSSTGTYSLVKTTTALSYTNSGLTNGKTYYYKVRTYRTVGTIKVYSAWTVVKSVSP
ncbi:Ig-like domain-containing protein [Gottfriedia acidiceleris]|uniref:Ig-like domain-containing protein n=1 Tax=Gottfriedia acidiceleris TaxID=371036 RepID=UPI003D1FD5FD